jgi:diaminohydroxyphosphoribosylaminopyrimidine deaminase/5-amino-6-(5-phosphoribosylamino)uracil reductase
MHRAHDAALAMRTRSASEQRALRRELKYPKTAGSFSAVAVRRALLASAAPEAPGVPIMIRSIAETLDEARLTQLLAELGKQAHAFRFEVAPNPCVGAALLAGDDVVARGYHEVWGERHAEIRALDAIADGGSRVRPDTLVVTLEPCSSHGKTPPCVDRILTAGLRRVVVGALDPDRRHRGEGLRILRDAGLEVVLLDGASPLAEVSPHFLAWTDSDRVRRARPWTIAKWAQTRTGQLVPPREVGGGRWISAPEALREVQLLRGRVDAIVTGVGTVLDDDPRLTVREPGDWTKPPVRVVLDSRLRTPPDAKLFGAPGPREGAGPVHILCVGGADATRHGALVAAGAIVHEMHVATDDGVALRDVQTWMWEQGYRRVLLEAGPRLITHFLDSGFVDQVRIYTGAVNGGRGPTMAEWLTRLKFDQRIDRELGTDAVLEAFLR